MKSHSRVPDGFRYHPDFLSGDEERDLVAQIARLPLAPFVFQGFTAKRRVLSFGYNYSFQTFKVTPGEPIPDFLLAVRETAAGLIEREAAELVETLVTEYPPGAGIGWHRDVAPFEVIVGISLAGACTMKLRRGKPRQREMAALVLAPRSAYVLSGPARTEWEHHIPATREARYSITFRTLTASWKAKLAPEG